MEDEDWINNTKNHLKEFTHNLDILEFMNYFLTIVGAHREIKEFAKYYDKYKKDLANHVSKQKESHKLKVDAHLPPNKKKLKL